MDRKIQIDIKDATWFVDELWAVFDLMCTEGVWKTRVFFETMPDPHVAHRIVISQIQSTWNSGATEYCEPQDTGPRPVPRIRKFCGLLLNKIWCDDTTYFDVSGHIDLDARTRDVLLHVDEKVVNTISSSEYIYAEPIDAGAT